MVDKECWGELDWTANGSTFGCYGGTYQIFKSPRQQGALRKTLAPFTGAKAGFMHDIWSYISHPLSLLTVWRSSWIDRALNRAPSQHHPSLWPVLARRLQRSTLSDRVLRWSAGGGAKSISWFDSTGILKGILYTTGIERNDVARMDFY